MTDTFDLVARLRRPVFGNTYGSGLAPDPLHTEAADTIEELDRMHRDATADCIRANEDADKLAAAVLHYHDCKLLKRPWWLRAPAPITEAITIAQRRVDGDNVDTEQGDG